LQNEKNLFLSLLHGKSPIVTNKKYNRGWRSHTGLYTIKEGYIVINSTLLAPPNPALWNEIWRAKCLPKIDMFIWTLAHNAILTGDNLRKKGWEGPTRCPFCVSKEETVAHLLLNCPFSLEIWNLALAPWMSQVSIPTKISSLLIRWMESCPFSLIKKERLKHCWASCPKVILWKLWLEHNSRIFKGNFASAAHVVEKAKAMLGGFLSSLHLQANKGVLTSIEED